MITGTEDRQHAYVALSRGTDINIAYVFTASPKRADPVPGPRPAPSWPAMTDHGAARDGEPATAAAQTSDARYWPACWTETASSAPRPRPGSRALIDATTWPS